MADKVKAHEILKALIEDEEEMGQTVSLSFTLVVQDPEGDLEDPENWDVAMGINSGGFEEVPEGIQGGLFAMVAGLQHGFFKHPQEVMDWATHTVFEVPADSPETSEVIN